MITSKSAKVLMRDYRALRQTLMEDPLRRAEGLSYDDTLIRVTGMSALARLEKPSGSDAEDWAELRELTYQTALRFVSAMESGE
jgi:hypothetical protein